MSTVRSLYGQSAEEADAEEADAEEEQEVKKESTRTEFRSCGKCGMLYSSLTCPECK